MRFGGVLGCGKTEEKVAAVMDESSVLILTFFYVFPYPARHNAHNESCQHVRLVASRSDVPTKRTNPSHFQKKNITIRLATHRND